MATRRKHGRVRDDLPAEVREQVDRLLLEGGVTYDDIKAFLDEQGFDISRSAIGRYGQDFLNAYQQLRIIEDKSKALISKAGEGLVLEEAASKMFAKMILEAQLEGSLDIQKLPRILSDFAKLQASSVMRERLKKEMVKKVAKVVDAAGKKDMSKEDVLKWIKEQVYGIA